MASTKKVVKNRNTRVASRSRTNTRVKSSPVRSQSKFNTRNAIIFAGLFAIIGGLFLYLSRADTSFNLSAIQLQKALSLNVSTPTEASGNKKDTMVMQIDNGSKATGKSVLSISNVPLGRYEACIYARATSGTPSVTLQAEEYGNGSNGYRAGAVGGPVGTSTFNVPTTSNYQRVGCNYFNHKSTVNTGIQATVFNKTANTTLRFGSVILRKISDIPAPEPAAVFTIPSTIAHKATCDSSMPNVSKQIQDWIDSVPEGSIARFLPDTCYRTEVSLYLYNRQDLVIDGNGSKLKQFTDGCDSQSDDGIFNNDCKYLPPHTFFAHLWPRGNTKIAIISGSNITIKNLSLDGGNNELCPTCGYRKDALEDGHGVSISKGYSEFNLPYANNIVLDHLRIDRTRGDFVHIVSAKNVWVTNGVFGEDNGDKSGSGLMGITPNDNTENINILNNRITKAQRSAIDIEPNSPGGLIKNIYIDSNIISEHRLNFIANVGTTSNMDGLYVRNNTVKGSGVIRSVDTNNPDPDTTTQYRRRNFEFINNSSTDLIGSPSRFIMIFSGVDGVLLANNTSPAQAGRSMAMAQFERSRNIQVMYNASFNAIQAGRFANRFNPDSNDYVAVENRNYCEKNNKVGNLQQITQTSGVPICQ